MVTRLGVDNSVIHKNIESLCWTPETNIILYINDNLIKKNLQDYYHYLY